VLLLTALRHLPAQPLTGCFLDGGRNLFGLFDRLGLAGSNMSRTGPSRMRAATPLRRRRSAAMTRPGG